MLGSSVALSEFVLHLFLLFSSFGRVGLRSNSVAMDASSDQIRLSVGVFQSELCADAILCSVQKAAARLRP